MFEFLKRHYTYYIMNSWNITKTIANNVKIYNLDLQGDMWKALEELQNEDYFTINDIISIFEDKHKYYKVYFNGRSGGYLILCNKHNNRNILPSIIEDSQNYEEFKQECKDFYGGVKYYKSDLQEYTKLVQDFDKLCDELRFYVNSLSI